MISDKLPIGHRVLSRSYGEGVIVSYHGGNLTERYARVRFNSRNTRDLYLRGLTAVPDFDTSVSSLAGGSNPAIVYSRAADTSINWTQVNSRIQNVTLQTEMLGQRLTDLHRSMNNWIA